MYYKKEQEYNRLQKLAGINEAIKLRSLTSSKGKYRNSIWEVYGPAYVRFYNFIKALEHYNINTPETYLNFNRLDNLSEYDTFYVIWTSIDNNNFLPDKCILNKDWFLTLSESWGIFDELYNYFEEEDETEDDNHPRIVEQLNNLDKLMDSIKKYGGEQIA